jgi:predicted transcriptional regulator
MVNCRSAFQFLSTAGFSFPNILSLLLSEVGITKSDIADKAGCSRPYVVMVLAGSRNSKSVESAISQALGFNPWA